ncbi:MAG TPA: hypothetical protein PKH10_06970 [bacterium]|nr:hypothetical protein [bacterium]
MTKYLMILVAAMLIVACGDEGTKGPAMGSKGGDCYGNGTCDGDLVCMSNVCVDPTETPDKDTAVNDEAPDDELDELTDVDDEQIVDNEEDDTDSLVNDDDKLDPEIAEEFNKPCYNPFIVAEIFAKKCVEYTKYTVNGLECGITVNMTEVGPMQTLECTTKEKLDKLKEQIIEDKPENWIDSTKLEVYNQVSKLYFSEKYGEISYKLIDKPDPILSNNDTVEGYITEFTFGGKDFNIVDVYRDKDTIPLIISDKNGTQAELIENAVIEIYDVNYPILTIQWEYGYCFYPPKDNLTRDFGVMGTYVLVNAKKAYDETNAKNEANQCDKVHEEQFEEYKEKVKKEN